MRFYAATSVRRTVQILGDVGAIFWTIAWVLIALKVHAVTLRLAVPGEKLESVGGDLSDRLTDAGSKVADLPLAGGALAVPFREAGAAASGLADAGHQQIEAVHQLALWLGLSVALIPILVVLVFYVPFRVRFIRRATAGQRFLDSQADLDLFALRAMNNQPLHVLARIDSDPVGAWRRGDAQVIQALARTELRSAGLQLPRQLG